MLKVLDNSVMLQAPLAYAVAQTGPEYAVAVKMNEDAAAPFFVKIDQNSRIAKADGGLLDFRLCTAGDLIHVTRVRALDNTAEVPFPDGVPIWPNGDLRPDALVVKANHGDDLQRRHQLAFVSHARNFGKGKKKTVVGKFFDPLTQKEGDLPGEGAVPLRFGDPLLVTYAAVPAGTWRHHRNCYRVPADIPYKPTATCMPATKEAFEPLSYRKLTKEELGSYEDIFGKSQEETPAKRGSRIEQLILAGTAMMQQLSDRERQLNGATIHVGLKEENEYEILLEAAYRPSGKDASLAVADRGRAARVMSVDQHLWIAPGASQGGAETRMILAKVKQSDVCREYVRCILAIPRDQAERLWTHSLTELLKRDWPFKCPENTILQKHFRQRLCGGSLSDRFARNQDRPALQALRALYGDATALANTDHGYSGRIYKTISGQSLTEEQSRAVYAAANPDVPLNLVEAPPGAGKSLATAQMLLEQTKKPGTCAAGMMPMNKAAESVLEDLAAEMAARPRKIMALQGAMFLSQKSSKDKYHSFRVPALLQQLAADDFGPLNPNEKKMVDNALTIASRRFEDLEGMNWGKAIYGSITDDTKDDYNKAVELLIRRYKPQIVLGTTSMLSIWAEQLRTLVTHVVIDEAGKVSTLDATCFLMTWPSTKSLTLIGDTKQLLNYVITAMPQEHRKWGFESLLAKADLHPNAFKTRLTKVFRSHPAIVSVLEQFVYGNLQTDVRDEERPLMKTTGLLKDPDFPILFIDCDGEHGRNFVNSYTNAQQTEVAGNVAQRLIAACPQADVRFFSLYGGARDELNESFKAQGLPYSAIAVDASQGQECDIAVLETAFVPGEDDKTAFLESKERINVAISRAKHGLVIIGSVEALQNVNGWEDLIRILMRATRESTSSGRAFVRSSVFLEAGDDSAPPQGLPLAMMALGHRSPRFQKDLIPEGSKRSAVPVAALDNIHRQPEPKKTRPGTDTSAKQADTTRQPGWIQQLINAESDDEDAPTKTVVIDDSDSDEDAVEDTVQRVVQLATDQVEQELADQLRRFSTASDSNNEDMEAEEAGASLGFDGIEDMDTDEAFLPPPPVPPKLQMDADSSSLPPPPAPPTLMEVGGTDEEERSGSPEPKTLIDLDAIAEAKARARRLRKPHMTKIKQEPALHGKQAPPKQGPVTENDQSEASDSRNAQEASEEHHMETQETPAPNAAVPSDAQPHEAEGIEGAPVEQNILQPPPAPPALQNDDDVMADQDEFMKRNFDGSAQAQVVIGDITEEDIASILDGAKMTSKQAPTKEEKAKRANRPKKPQMRPAGRMPTLRAEQTAAATDKECEPDDMPPVLEPQAKRPPLSGANTGLKSDILFRIGEDSDESDDVLLRLGEDSDGNEVPIGEPKDVNASKRHAKPSGSKPRYVEDLFESSDDDQQPTPKASSTPKKVAKKPPAKATNATKKTRTVPQESGSSDPTPKTWTFPASAKAIKQVLWYDKPPYFPSFSEHIAWKKAGNEALQAAVKLKAQKKADGLEVSSSESEEEEARKVKKIPMGRRRQFAIRYPKKFAKLKEAERQQAAATTQSATAAEPQDDTEKHPEPAADNVKQQPSAQEAPRRSQRSVSRERSVERKKVLLMPPNPPVPPNLEKPKSKPSAGAFKQPRASLFPKD